MTNMDTNVFRVRLSGGLGNQLFQVAAGIFFANEFRARFSVDNQNLKFENKHPNSDLNQVEYISRHYQTNFRKNKFALGNRALRKLSRSNNYFAYRNHVITDKNWKDVYSQLQYEELNSLYRYPNIWDLYGYFQDTQFITENTLTTLKTLQNTSSAFKKESHLLQAQPFNAIHIRGGDYLTSDIHAQLQGGYYMEGIKHLRYSKLPLIVFTNDPQHARKLIRKQANYKIQDSSGMTALEVMHLMSMSTNLVISNSTFSYWAARFKGPSGVTVAPQNWYSKNTFNALEYERHWVVI